jgi:type I restriction enzyme S subunit
VASKRLKYVVSLRRSRVDGTQEDRPYIGLENIESATGRLIGNPVATVDTTSPATAEGESLSNTFERGDVLFGKLRPYLAKAWIAEFAGRCTTELLVMQPVEAEARFLRYVCLCRDFIDAVDASTFGSKMPRADWDFIGNMPVPVPEWPRQRAIADYLDRETARLDALVAAKQRVLGLLAEKRRALITRAVTRGLDPRAPLRDSGIPWLGEIPAHWRAVRLKFLSTEPLAYGANESASEDDPSYPRFVRITDIHEDGSLRAETFRSLPPETAAPYVLEDGDILFARSGATVGKVFIYKSSWGAACFAGYLIRLRCNTRLVHAEFVYNYAQTEVYWGQVREGTIQATIQNFSAEKYGDLAIGVPPIEEQQRIIAHIRRETARLDSLRVSTERTIALLKERRAALIAAAVTGQIDVGQHAKQQGASHASAALS